MHFLHYFAYSTVLRYFTVLFSAIRSVVYTYVTEFRRTRHTSDNFLLNANLLNPIPFSIRIIIQLDFHFVARWGTDEFFIEFSQITGIMIYNESNKTTPRYPTLLSFGVGTHYYFRKSSRPFSHRWST